MRPNSRPRRIDEQRELPRVFRKQKQAMETTHDYMTLADLEEQHAVELPARDLMIAVTVLGIPVVGLQGVQLSLNVS